MNDSWRILVFWLLIWPSLAAKQCQGYLSRHFSHPMLVLVGTPVVGVRGNSIWWHTGVLQGYPASKMGSEWSIKVACLSVHFPLQLLLWSSVSQSRPSLPVTCILSDLDYTDSSGISTTAYDWSWQRSKQRLTWEERGKSFSNASGFNIDSNLQAISGVAFGFFCWYFLSIYLITFIYDLTYQNMLLYLRIVWIESRPMLNITDGNKNRGKLGAIDSRTVYHARLDGFTGIELHPSFTGHGEEGFTSTGTRFYANSSIGSRYAIHTASLVDGRWRSSAKHEYKKELDEDTS